MPARCSLGAPAHVFPALSRSRSRLTSCSGPTARGAFPRSDAARSLAEVAAAQAGQARRGQATATAASQISGAALTAPPGSRGTWLNGEMSSSHCPAAAPGRTA